MKTKYVVELTVELSKRLTKKRVREWMIETLVYVTPLEELTKLRVRSVDED